jgi:TonB family protein
MENNLFTVIGETALALVVYYAVYHIFMKNERFFRVNRFYLLSSIIFSLVYPFIHPTFSFSTAAEIPIMMRDNFYLPLITVTENAVRQFSWIKLMNIVYCSGVVISLTIFIIQLLKITFLILKSEKEIMEDTVIIKISRNHSPFSFFKYIFIPENQYDAVETERIILHERKHVSEHHTADLILCELIKAFQWFNPVIYLYKKELHAIHEYMADESVTLSGVNRNEYLSLLIFNISDSVSSGFWNNFSILLTKKRIKMIMNTKRKSCAWLKVMPAMVLTVCLLAAHTSCTQQMLDKQETLPSSFPNEVFDAVEAMLGFPGGYPALREFLEFLSENTQYPVVTQANGIQGKVTLKFIVTGKGEIKDVKIIKGVDPDLDKEATRVVSKMPNWIPGKIKNEPVDVYLTLPIDFRL